MPEDWSSERNRLLLARQLGGRLRDARSRSELVLAVAAAQAGISEQFLSDCERGRRLPSLPVLVALADAYQVLLTDLLAGLYPFGSRQRPRRVPPPPADGRLIQD